MFLISISLTQIEGVENEGYQRERNNLGSLSWKNCRPSEIPTRDQAVHQVGRKKRKENVSFLFCRNSYDNDLFFAMRGAGSSFGIATEFLYVINRTPGLIFV